MTRKITKLTTIPENSVIGNGFDKVDYCDSFCIAKSTTETAKEVAAQLFNLPKWVKWLMYIRNSIVRVFGLKTERKSSQNTFFTVIEQSEDEIVLGEKDKHLDFRVSVFIDRVKSLIFVTTLVRFNNRWGKIYFIPVKPFHKLIIRSVLKNI